MYAGDAAVDRYLMPARPTAANLQHAGRDGRTGGETDRRTLYRCMEPARHTMLPLPETVVIIIIISV